jgi:hypothetical protein
MPTWADNRKKINTKVIWGDNWGNNMKIDPGHKSPNSYIIPNTFAPKIKYRSNI